MTTVSTICTVICISYIVLHIFQYFTALLSFNFSGNCIGFLDLKKPTLSLVSVLLLRLYHSVRVSSCFSENLLTKVIYIFFFSTHMIQLWCLFRIASHFRLENQPINRWFISCHIVWVHGFDITFFFLGKNACIFLSG